LNIAHMIGTTALANFWDSFALLQPDSQQAACCLRFLVSALNVQIEGAMAQLTKHKRYCLNCPKVMTGCRSCSGRLWPMFLHKLNAKVKMHIAYR